MVNRRRFVSVFKISGFLNPPIYFDNNMIDPLPTDLRLQCMGFLTLKERFYSLCGVNKSCNRDCYFSRLFDQRESGEMVWPGAAALSLLPSAKFWSKVRYLTIYGYVDFAFLCSMLALLRDITELKIEALCKWDPKLNPLCNSLINLKSFHCRFSGFVENFDWSSFPGITQVGCSPPTHGSFESLRGCWNIKTLSLNLIQFSSVRSRKANEKLEQEIMNLVQIRQLELALHNMDWTVSSTHSWSHLKSLHLLHPTSDCVQHFVELADHLESLQCTVWLYSFCSFLSVVSSNFAASTNQQFHLQHIRFEVHCYMEGTFQTKIQALEIKLPQILTNFQSKHIKSITLVFSDVPKLVNNTNAFPNIAKQNDWVWNVERPKSDQIQVNFISTRM